MNPDNTKPDYMFGIRLTPEPDDGRKAVIRTDLRVGPNVLVGWRRELKRGVFRAIEHRVVVPNRFCMATHQAQVDTKRPALSDPGLRDNHRLVEAPDDKPSVLVDRNGVIIAWIFPNFLPPDQVTYHNTVCEANARTEFPDGACKKGAIPGSKSNGQARGGVKTYKPAGGFRGTRTYMIAWHERPKKESQSFAPSYDIIICRTIQQAMQRDLFFCSLRDTHWRINTLLEMIHPELHRILSALRLELQIHPTCKKLLSIWESLFPGHSFICNRTTGRHVDYNGVRRGFEAILAGGKFTGGSIYLKDVNARLPLLPGTLVFLDGTALRHEIESWTGNQRISHAFFMHQSVFVELSIPTHLPDVTLQSVEARLSTPSDAGDLQRPSKRTAQAADFV